MAPLFIFGHIRLRIQVHSSKGYSPFDLIISRPHPPAELAFSSDAFPVPNMQSAVVPDPFVYLVVGIPNPETHALRAQLRHRLALQLPRVRARLDLAGRSYRRHADRHAHAYDPDHLVGKRVALRREVRVKKLAPHGLGVYKFIAADEHTVTIATSLVLSTYRKSATSKPSMAMDPQQAS
jgi:hypothetical protein